MIWSDGWGWGRVDNPPQVGNLRHTWRRIFLAFSDVAAIVYGYCAPCHHAGGPGPFSLTSYAEIRAHARQIVEVTRSRYMPPWLPDQGHGDFAHELRLNDGQIATIAKWVADHEPDGVSAASPSFKNGWTLGKPDLVVTASKAFSVPASGTDVYWNFVFTPDVKASHYVRAVEIRPRNAKLIHHANIIVDRFGAVTEPFAGMDVAVPRQPLDLDGHFLFFKPGAVSEPEPDGFSWRLDPGSTLVLNTHMQPSGKAETEQPTVALYFTDKPPVHAAYLLQLENDNALNIPAGARDFVVSDEFELPIDTEVLAVYPHAHYLGKLLEAYATLPDGTRKWLIRIPEWDPNWQSVYRYLEPVSLPAGTVISMRYHFDNSTGNPRNPNRPPKRVEAGNRASDEMAHLWLQIMPKNPRESRRIYAEAWAEQELRKNPRNYAADVTIGSLELARFDALDAVKPLHDAVALNPRDAIAHNLYGTALDATGRNAEARQEFEKALAIKPGFTNARFNLAHALVKAGKKDEAIENLKVILKGSPGDQDAAGFLAVLTGRGIH
jgi:tetratricopeptide (TPR) repeat protein/mono/diheme cytochrome c family protein